MRTNGMSTNKVNMGHFRLKNGENCMMFVHEDGGPVLELRTVDSALFYLNCATEEGTLEMIEQVKALER
jgi:ATP-dependent Clp protease adapter protein ClpS